MNRQELGEAGEQAVLDFLTDWDTRRSVVQGFATAPLDVRDVPRFQQADIDIVVPGFGSIEVKTDSHTTGNLALEVGRGPGRPGCFLRSTADWWFYLLPGLGQGYLMSRTQLLAHMVQGVAEGQYTVRNVQARGDYRGQGDLVTYQAVLVPVRNVRSLSLTREYRVTSTVDGLSISCYS